MPDYEKFTCQCTFDTNGSKNNALLFANINSLISIAQFSWCTSLNTVVPAFYTVTLIKAMHTPLMCT